MKYVTFLLLCIVSTAFAGDKKLDVKPLAPNVYQHISYKNVEPWGMVAASGLVILDGKDAYLIDTPWSQSDTKALVKWVTSQGLIVKGAIVTHFHEDASGGLAVLNSLKIKTYATSLTNDLLNANHKEQSNQVIEDDVYQLLNNKIEVFHPGAGHSKDNIVVWLPENSMLFGGCFVKNLKSKSLGYTGDASIKDWSASIENVLNKYPNIKVVVPGHGEVGDASLLRHTAELALKNGNL